MSGRTMFETSSLSKILSFQQGQPVANTTDGPRPWANALAVTTPTLAPERRPLPPSAVPLKEPQGRVVTGGTTSQVASRTTAT
jgi:hypothetical protein